MIRGEMGFPPQSESADEIIRLHQYLLYRCGKKHPGFPGFTVVFKPPIRAGQQDWSTARIDQRFF
jgi:hypothetical protein